MKETICLQGNYQLSDELDDNLTIDEFASKLGVTDEEYHEALSITKRGKMLVLKRKVKDRYINNYIVEWLESFDANMDAQFVFDVYAVLTYVCEYVTKDETGMTEFLKAALKSSADLTINEKLKALRMAYLNNRQIGASETVYRLVKSMKLKHSNITCQFVATGFKDNRATFYKKVSDEEDEIVLEEDDDDKEEEDDEENGQIEKSKIDRSKLISIENKPGLYLPNVTPHERYALRPTCVEEISFAEFVMNYVYAAKRPKKVVFDENGSSQNVSTKKIANSDICMPQYLEIEEDEKGCMRLRRFPLVLRYHNSKRKEGHEQHYAEMLLFSHWRDEENEFHRYDPQKCIEKFHEKEESITSLRRAIYPGEEVLEMLDNQDLSEFRPTAIYDKLDAEGEQDQEDDQEQGAVDDLRYVGRQYDREQIEKKGHGNQGFEDFKYKKLNVPSKDEMNFLTRRLAPEQLRILNIVVHYAKQVKKARSSPHEPPVPVRLIVHGGAGVGKSAVVRVITSHVENILRQPGDHPHRPRVLILAPTGKAASLIDGVTIHSGFDFKFGSTFLPLSEKNLVLMRDTLKDLKLIIIDEFSMMGADMLYMVHMRLCEIFQADEKTEFFANKSVILVGDLLQLKPVRAQYIFEEPGNEHFAAFSKECSLFDQFEPIVLEHNHRQAEERDFADTLNRIRIAAWNDEDEALLRTRLTKKKMLEEEALHIFYTNDEVNDLNDEMLESLDGEEVIIDALTFGPKKHVPKLNKGLVDNTQFVKKLKLKVGARVTLTFNVNVVDDLVNGSLGTVVGIEKDGNGNVEVVMVKFDTESSGIQQREKYPNLSRKYKDVNGTPIFRQELEYQLENKRGFKMGARAKVVQFPLRLAWGVTSHKCQVNGLLK